jgi:phosphate transport system protein
MTARLEESLQRDFDRVRALLAKMSQVAIQMLRDCVTALERRDRELASLIILRDQRIDQMEKETDRFCLEFILRHQPAGAHLRFAYAALQVNFELERVGDYAESIARQVNKLVDLDARIPPGIFTEITAASISMLENAVAAFLHEDAGLAAVTQNIEEQVDVLRNQANSELMHLVQSNRLPLAALTPLLTIARRFERVSDQAKSICQETIYICTGEYSKHYGAQQYKVLFVDDHHGCLSRLAEAIGRGLGRSDFEFASAGITAQPLPPDAAELLRSKGIDSAQPQPRDLRNVADFSQYHLTVALTPGAKRELPAPSRKAVQLEWSISDPCANSGSPEQRKVFLETASRALTQQLSHLISSLYPEEPIENKGMHA